MSDPIKHFRQNNGLEQPTFAANSRYAGEETSTWLSANGLPVVYVRRRFVPPAENFATLQEHQVAEGDRLDNIAATYFGDPQQYWRLCDANGAMRPAELTDAVGRRLRITLPAGIPAPTEET